MILNKYDRDSVCEYTKEFITYLEENTDLKVLTLILDSDHDGVHLFSNIASKQRIDLLQSLLMQEFKKNGLPDKYKDLIERIVNKL